LKYGQYAEIVKPVKVREAFKKLVEGIISIYNPKIAIERKKVIEKVPPICYIIYKLQKQNITKKEAPKK
jgi:hypothetical protein